MKKLAKALLMAALLIIVPVTVAVAVPEKSVAANTVLVNGVAVNQESTSLNLSGATIEDLGVFGTELAQLPYLNYVDLSNSNLTNEQMEMLQASFPQVKFAWVVHMKHWSLRTDAVAFSTQQPKEIVEMLYDADIQVLKYCKDLVALDLGHHRLTDLSVLVNCRELRVLILADNKYSDITPLAYLPNLMYLELFCSRVSDLHPLLMCENLIDLNVSFTRVSDVTPLMYFPHLQRLWFTHTYISEADRNALIARYPGVKMDYTSENSISQGWRNHSRFTTMRSMYQRNNVQGEFLTTVLDDSQAFCSVYRDLIFDPSYYIAVNPDVAAVFGTNPDLLYYHYMAYGIWEGRLAHPTFNLGAYVSLHPDYPEVYGNYLPKYCAVYIKQCLGLL